MHLDFGGASYIYSKFLQASSEYTKYDCVKNTILIYLFMLLFKTGVNDIRVIIILIHKTSQHGGF
jgi:hypothetical protein